MTFCWGRWHPPRRCLWVRDCPHPLAMYLGDIYTVMINIAGLPSLALPCGFDTQGMPVGMQLIGRPFEEETILCAGHAFQSVTDYHKQSPVTEKEAL